MLLHYWLPFSTDAPPDKRKIYIAMFWFTEYVEIDINTGEYRYGCILHDNTSSSLNKIFFFFFLCNCDEGNSPTFWHKDVITLHTAAISIAERESNIAPWWRTYFQKGEWLQWCGPGFFTKDQLAKVIS